MDFKEIQQKIIQNTKNYSKEYNVKIDEDFALLKLYEEVGELAQAVLIHRKKVVLRNIYLNRNQKRN